MTLPQITLPRINTAPFSFGKSVRVVSQAGALPAETFARKHLVILDKSRRQAPLIWNRAQQHFHANRTGRDLILKARQLGFSTYIQGEMFRSETLF
jgi:hypothetical protein